MVLAVPHLCCTTTGAVLLGSLLKSDAPMIYARRNCLMTQAHAGFLNGGQCIKYKSPLVGWDDCAEWSKLENVRNLSAQRARARARARVRARGCADQLAACPSLPPSPHVLGASMSHDA